MLTIIKKIKPDENERKKVNAIVKAFMVVLKKNLNGLKPELAGSFEKNTWLSGDHDIDVFVKFPYEKYKDKDISKLLEKKLVAYTKVHGSRDYFQIQYKNYLFELIPVLNIKSSQQAKNITDISPLHSTWVKKNIKNYSDEIRLFKQFLKANSLYGAESYIKGFSGYLTEVLVIHYKGFDNLIKAASSWNDKEIIDPERHYKSKEEALKKLNQSKHSNLIIIDPVQKTRNIAAALSKEKYISFISLCNKFLHNPSTNFFEKKELNIKELKSSFPSSHVLHIQLEPLKGKKDVVGSKLLKTFDFLKDRMKMIGFIIKESGWEFNNSKKADFWIIIENALLPEHRKHYGPFKHDKINIEKFKARWKSHKLYEDSGKVYVLVKQEFRTPIKFAKHVLNQDYCRENFKKILRVSMY